jgi:hypothetical protein
MESVPLLLDAEKRRNICTIVAGRKDGGSERKYLVLPGGGINTPE